MRRMQWLQGARVRRLCHVQRYAKARRKGLKKQPCELRVCERVRKGKEEREEELAEFMEAERQRKEVERVKREADRVKRMEAMAEERRQRLESKEAEKQAKIEAKMQAQVARARAAALKRSSVGSKQRDLKPPVLPTELAAYGWGVASSYPPGVPVEVLGVDEGIAGACFRAVAVEPLPSDLPNRPDELPPRPEPSVLQPPSADPAAAASPPPPLSTAAAASAPPLTPHRRPGCSSNTWTFWRAKRRARPNSANGCRRTSCACAAGHARRFPLDDPSGRPPPVPPRRRLLGCQPRSHPLRRLERRRRSEAAGEAFSVASVLYQATHRRGQLSCVRCGCGVACSMATEAAQPETAEKVATASRARWPGWGLRAGAMS